MEALQINANLSALYILGAIFAASFGTALTRFLPFFLLKGEKKRPILEYLQKTMPLLIMTLLVFFSLKDVPFSENYGIYEIGGILGATLCFFISKNAVLSMFVGIIFYIFAIQFF